MTRLIGLYSPAPQSGKTTIASYLHAAGYKRVSFAAPLKRLVALLLEELGLPEAEAMRYVHKDKEEIIPLVRTTARHMLQTIGTEYGRSCIHPPLWVMCAEAQITQLMAEGTSVVIDDCRFPNEAALILRLGGELWRVERSSATRTTSHASEGSLDDYPLFDRRIVNDGTLLELYAQVTALTKPVLTAA